MASIRRKGLGNDEKGVSKGSNTALCLAVDSLFKSITLEVSGASNLESTSAWHYALVDDCVVNASQTITNSIRDLSNSVLIGSLDQQRNGLGILDLLHESVLFLPKRLLINKASIAKAIRSHVLDTVLGNTTADELQALHVATLRAAQGKNAVLGKDIQGQRVDTLLVDNDKVLLAIGSTNLLLQVNNLLKLGVDESSLALNKLVTLLSARVEEARIDF